MDKHLLKWHRAAIGGISFFALLSSLLYAFLTLSHYDSSLGHFAPGLLAELFFPLCLIVAIAFAVFVAVLLCGKVSGLSLDNGPLTVFSSAFMAVCGVAWLFDTALALLPGKLQATERILLLLSFLFAIGFVAYAALCAIPGATQKSSTLCGVSAALFCIFYAMLAYFDTTFSMNSPIKQLDLVCFICLALFFLTESQLRNGKNRKLLYLCFCGIAACFCAVDSLPGLIYALVKHQPLVGSVTHDFLLFSLFLYTLARFCTPVFAPLSHRTGDQDDLDGITTPGSAAKNAPSPGEQDPRFDTSANTTIDFDQK